jgi:hypothetical protein
VQCVWGHGGPSTRLPPQTQLTGFESAPNAILSPMCGPGGRGRHGVEGHESMEPMAGVISPGTGIPGQQVATYSLPR